MKTILENEKFQKQKMDKIYHKYLTCFNNPEIMVEALKARESIRGQEDLTVQNYQQALDDIDKGDFNRWQLKEKERVGGWIMLGFEMSPEEFSILCKYIKMSELLKIEAAIFYAIFELNYIFDNSPFHPDMKPLSLRLKIDEKNPSLVSYQISDEHRNVYTGKISNDGLNFPETDLKNFVPEHMVLILEKIAAQNPKHVNSDIMHSFAQYFLQAFELESEEVKIDLMKMRMEFQQKCLRFFIDDYSAHMISLLLDEFRREGIFPELHSTNLVGRDKMNYILSNLMNLKEQKQECINEIRACLEVLQSQEIKEYPEILKPAVKDVMAQASENLEEKTALEIKNLYHRIKKVLTEYHDTLLLIRKDLPKLLDEINQFLTIYPDAKISEFIAEAEANMTKGLTYAQLKSDYDKANEKFAIIQKTPQYQAFLTAAVSATKQGMFSKEPLESKIESLINTFKNWF
jgi:hypothetical protein